MRDAAEGPVRERRALEFVARHALIDETHMQRFFATTREDGRELLDSLTALGLLHRDALPTGRDAYRITAAGLTALGSDLPPPAMPKDSRHALAAAWVWLAADHGAFGEIQDKLSAREQHHADHTGPLPALAGGRAFGLTVAGREHFLDLVLFTGGRRVDVHLHLTRPDPIRLDAVMHAYTHGPAASHVLFLVTDTHIGETVIAAAERAGIRELIRVQLVSDNRHRSKACPPTP